MGLADCHQTLDPNLVPPRIRETYGALHRHIRKTPIIEVDDADFGVPNSTLVFKLEYLQHGGSFKTRGAFATS